MSGAARGKSEPVMKMISSFPHVMLELKTLMRHDDLRNDFNDSFLGHLIVEKQLR